MDSNTYDHVMAKWFRSIVSALKHSIRLSQGMSTVKVSFLPPDLDRSQALQIPEIL